MHLLAIETSTPVLSVAIQKSDGRIVEKHLEGFSQHAENLLPLLDRTLKATHLGLQDIEAYLMGRGPGSFTGLRVGFATLKALLSVTPRPCFGALSLDMIAENIPAKGIKSLAVCMDARRDKLYTRFYRSVRGFWIPQGTAKVLDADQWLRAVPEASLVTGDALERYQDLFKKAENLKTVRRAAAEASWPRASSLIRMFARQNFKAGAATTVTPMDQPKDLIPYYLRLSEAEERRREHAPAC